MARRVDTNVADVLPIHWSGAGTNYIVQTASGVLYMVYLNAASDVAFKKSTDGGLTWGPSTAIYAGTCTALAVWYDRWSAIASDYIVCAYTESASDDTLFRTINTASADALSTQTVIFAGSSAAAGGHLSVTRSVGGNVYCKTVIDAGAEGGFFRLTNANFPDGAWDAARTVDEATATKDQMILVPDFAAVDTADIMAIFWDASANEISRKLYDDSANTWAESSISGSMTEWDTQLAYPCFDIAVDLTNSQIVLVAWSNTATPDSDLRCWTITSATIAEKTNVVLNSMDEQGLCAVSIDGRTGWWYSFYGGNSAGTDTWNTAMHIYYKVSKDAGTSWGPETLLDTDAAFNLRNLYTTAWLYRGPFVAAWVSDANTDDLKISVDRTTPQAAYVAGVV